MRIGSHFFAYLSRMRFIQRWALMRNTAPENVQEHSHQVAVLAHALAVIRRRFLTVFPHFTRFSTGNQLALFGEKEYSKIKMIRGVSWGRKAESGI